jgi:hypothetical protein
MVAEVIWQRDALRELTIWIAGYIRDEIELRAVREGILDEVKHILTETDGRPPNSYVASTARGEVTIWEYSDRALYLLFRRETRPAGFWRRLLGEPVRDVFIVSSMRRRPTPQELESLPG